MSINKTMQIDQPSVSMDPAIKIIAMASSAGGLHALSQILSELPPNFPAVILIVQHLDPRYRSMMADILNRRIPLIAKEADQGDQLEVGRVYLAPPDQHMLVNPDASISLTHSELVHFVRPSADLLFESVAASFKERVIAIVLTGSGSDGSMGVLAVKKMGGIVIAQDKATCEFFGMPGAAIETGSVDFVLPLDEIAKTLVSMVVKGSVP